MTGSAVGGVSKNEQKIPFSAHMEREALNIGANLAMAEYTYDVNPTKTNKSAYQHAISVRNQVVKNVESFMTSAGAQMYINHIKIGESNFYSNREKLTEIRRNQQKRQKRKR